MRKWNGQDIIDIKGNRERLRRRDEEEKSNGIK